MNLAGRAIFLVGYLAYAATLFIPIFGHMVRGQDVGITGLGVLKGSAFGPFTFPETIMLLLSLGEAKGLAFSVITTWVLASTLFILLSPLPFIWIKQTWTPVWILILSFANLFLFFKYLQPDWTLKPGFYLWMAASLAMLYAFSLKNFLNREKKVRPKIAGRWMD